jgi:magnesium-protoporphyrin O-methyltransferase
VSDCECGFSYRDFDDKTARRELKAYRRSGPDRSTRILLDLIEAERGDASSLLDIGGGVGAIHHELLEAGFASATDVDGSAAFVAASREEAERRGHAARLTHRQGDFVRLAPEIEAADVVTLDRVICCYPDMPALVGLSAARARRLYGLVHPRDDWWMRVAVAIPNFFNRLFRKQPIYLYRTRDVDRTVERAGLALRAERRTLAWRVSLYARAEVS